jgi:UDPglucose 6-dehydrogenase
MVVIGARSTRETAAADQVLAGIEAPRLTMGIEAAEMVKHAINAYLATCISFINELANISELVGADAVEVARGLRADRRVSPHAPLWPGLGFAGATLARDVRVLSQLASGLGYAPTLVESVLAVNSWQNSGVIRKLQRALGSLKGRRIGVLGLTYKAGTSSLRRSASIETIEAIVDAGGTVAVYDPKAESQPASRAGVDLCGDAYEAAQAADAIVMMTAWPEFQHLDFVRLRQVMRGRILIDGQNAFDMQRLSDLGFTYLGMGRSRVAAGV